MGLQCSCGGGGGMDGQRNAFKVWVKELERRGGEVKESDVLDFMVALWCWKVGEEDTCAFHVSA